MNYEEIIIGIINKTELRIKACKKEMIQCDLEGQERAILLRKHVGLITDDHYAINNLASNTYEHSKDRHLSIFRLVDISEEVTGLSKESLQDIKTLIRSDTKHLITDKCIKDIFFRHLGNGIMRKVVESRCDLINKGYVALEEITSINKETKEVKSYVDESEVEGIELMKPLIDDDSHFVIWFTIKPAEESAQ